MLKQATWKRGMPKYAMFKTTQHCTECSRKFRGWRFYPQRRKARCQNCTARPAPALKTMLAALKGVKVFI